MSAADDYLEDLVVMAWDWSAWMRNGCEPPDDADVRDLIWIQAFALGRFGPDGVRRIRERLRPQKRIHQHEPGDAVPPKLTKDELQAIVHGRTSLEVLEAAR